MDLENNVKRIKIFFSAAILVLVLVVFSGIKLLKENIYISSKYSRLVFDYLKYETEILNQQGLTQAAGVVLFPSTKITYSKNYALSVPVLAYHRIVLKPDGANVDLENFKDQMFALKDSGFKTVSLEDLEAFLKGQKNLPEKSIMVTFDDGAKDSFYPVDPILHALDFQAVNFVIGEHSVAKDSKNTGGYYLDKSELKAMLRSDRWGVGSHSWDCHSEIPIGVLGERGYCLTNLKWLSPENRLESQEEYFARVRDDLFTAQQELESKLDIKVSSFAFPFGDYGYNSKNNIENASTTLDQIISGIYTLNFYQPFGGESTQNMPKPGLETYYVKRIKVNPDWSGQDLIQEINEGIQ